MNKFLIKILICLLVIFGFGFFSNNYVLAGDSIMITPSPVFETGNLVPGSEIQETVIIENNSNNEYQSITLNAERIDSGNNPDLAEMIDLKIRKNQEIKIVNLADLLNGEAIFLPGQGIGPNKQESYEFTAEFSRAAGNEYQNKNLVFDFIFTFYGEEAETVTVIVPGGRGFVSLNVFNESAEEVGEDFVVIAWNTNLPAFGRVIYDVRSDQFNFAQGEPSYGYAFFSPKTETRSTFHSVTLTGLIPGTTYYYRVVSYGSLAISRQFSFTTAGVRGEEIVFHPLIPDFPLIPEAYAEDVEEDEEREEDIISPEEEKDPEEEKEEKGYFEKSLAAIGAIPFNLRIFLVIVFFILIGLIALRLTKKKRKNL